LKKSLVVETGEKYKRAMVQFLAIFYRIIREKKGFFVIFSDNRYIIEQN